MKITLKTLGKTFDITKHVDQSKTMVKNTLDGTLNTGKIVLSAMYFDELGDGIDLERRIPVRSLVEIEALDKTHQFYIKSDDVNKLNNKLATHTIELEDLKSLLGERPIPDMSVTQPTGETLNYVSEASKVLNQSINRATSWTAFSLDLSSPSNDTFIVENRTLKHNKTFSLVASISMFFQGGAFDGSFAITINGTPIETISFNTASSNGVYGDTFNLSRRYSANVGDVVGLSYKFDGTFMAITKGSIKISTEDNTQGDLIYLDSVVGKILRLHNISNQNEYTLDPSSKARLSTILAYDTMEIQQTQLSLLEKIASYVKARLSVYIQGNQKFVEFQFYDEMSQITYNEVHRDTQVARTENTNHYSGLSVEADNVITETLIYEPFKSLRPLDNDTALMTTDNICIKTSQPIDKIDYIRVKGFPILSSSNETLRNEDVATQITKRIVEKPHYDVLDKMSDYSPNGRKSNSQNNHLYYVRGDNKIYGMASVGHLAVRWTESQGNRALYETVYATYQGEYPNADLKQNGIDKGLAMDQKVLISISYTPMIKTNALVLKSDQANFEEKAITRLNSSSRVNQIDFLGNYAKGRIDSMGGTEISFYGDTKTIDGLPIVGTVDSQGYRLITLTQQVNPIATSFVATIVKDHVFQSNYIGIDSDRRLYEIPKDEYVLRVDKKYTTLNVGFLPLPNYAITDNFLMHFFKILNNTLYTKVSGASLTYYESSGLTRLVSANVTTTATANTIEMFYRMHDNYSVGFKRVDLTDKSYQLGVRYVDSFGRSDELKIEFLTTPIILNVNEANNFPDGHFTGDTLDTVTYSIKKDARECLAFSNQFIYQSLDPNILIYSGIGKHFINGSRIKLAVLQYEPTLDNKVIDLGRSITQNNNTVVEANYIEVDLQNQGVGYAWYEEQSNELLMVVKKTITRLGKHTICIGSENYT